MSTDQTDRDDCVADLYSGDDLTGHIAAAATHLRAARDLAAADPLSAVADEIQTDATLVGELFLSLAFGQERSWAQDVSSADRILTRALAVLAPDVPPSEIGDAVLAGSLRVQRLIVDRQTEERAKLDDLDEWLAEQDGRARARIES
jgi:hypothetical protein